MFPKKFFFAAEPEKMKFSASLWQNGHLMSSLYAILTKDTFAAKV